MSIRARHITAARCGAGRERRLVRNEYFTWTISSRPLTDTIVQSCISRPDYRGSGCSTGHPVLRSAVSPTSVLEAKRNAFMCPIL